MSVFLALSLAATPPAVLDLPRDEAPAQSREYQSPSERLENRLDALRSAETDERAAIIADEVRSLWRQRAGATADLLLQRAETAIEARDLATAERAYSHLRLLEPDFAEGWIASAELAASQGDWSFALEALNTAVTLDERRFDAWALLGRALERAEANQAALEAYEEALALHPRHPEARSGRARLERALAGRSL
ncbi:MAG: tetratricopeptide repeat protein [Alphaproteobacteria bacterium]|nr:tetratricopeptide repeat protein [Alphaproteobacteria bacterium]